MFIQAIQAHCTRHDEVRALSKVWREELAPAAEGWLGGTYGFTDDDQFLAVVRFESREEAMRNSARPEQTAFAERMTALMDGPVEFHDCDDVTVFLDGGSDDAGFVQVIRGKVADPDRVKASLADTDELHRLRPEIIGGTFAAGPDGTFTETVAFADEAAARAGERVEPPEGMREEIEAMFRGASFYDLRSPWFESA
jgi:hypothetical protein